MQVCGLTRILFPAMFVAIVVATFTGNEPLAWSAAIIAGLAFGRTIYA